MNGSARREAALDPRIVRLQTMILPRERDSEETAPKPVPAYDTHVADAVLIAACQGGDQAALRHLVERHIDRVYTLALRLMANRHDAEDLVQETFVRAIRGLPTFRGDSRFSTWLYRICHNLFLNGITRRSTRANGGPPPDTLPASGRGPRDTTLAAERARLVRDSLKSLHRELREVVCLHYLDELSYDEIAEVLGIPIGTVRSRLHRARGALARRLGVLMTGGNGS